jgi:hypothetical protein
MARKILLWRQKHSFLFHSETVNFEPNTADRDPKSLTSNRGGLLDIMKKLAAEQVKAIIL